VLRIGPCQATLLVALWTLTVASIARDRGLFDWLGVDYALFASGAEILLSDRPADVYDQEAVARRVQAYAPYYGPYADPLKVGPLPYPMPCFLLYAPFARLAPPVGFLLWTAANLLLAAHVTRGLSARLGDPSWSTAVALLTYFPLAYGVFVGQPVVALLFALHRAYRDLERGRDFRAGLWTGILLF
jgi:hypothetical protein